MGRVSAGSPAPIRTNAAAEALGVRPIAVLAAVAALAAGVAGCGSAGASAGATVDAYVAAPLCPAARTELARAGGEAGDLKVRAICLAPGERGAPGSSSGGAARGTGGARLDLAAIGAGARRATQDSAAVAYLEPPGPANRFAQPIVAEAGIAFVLSSSGKEAMHRTLKAIEAAGSGPIRDEVSQALEAE